MRASVDALVVRDNRVFGYGWAFASEDAIQDLKLEVTQTNGQKVLLPLSYGKARPDVEQAFPGEVHACYSGWMVYAAWEGASASSLSLVGSVSDGSFVSVPLSLHAESVSQPTPAVMPGVQRWTAALRRVLGRQSPQALPTVARDAALPSAPAGQQLSEVMSCIRLALAESGQSRCSLVIDHDMGGGANHFRAQWIASRSDDRAVSLLFSFEISSLRYIVEIHNAGRTDRFLLEDETVIGALAESGCIEEVFYNDAVSFPRPGEVPGWLVAFRRNSDVRLIIAVHDYFAICPSQFLLNDAGRFCRIPEISECLRCLPVNPNEFSGLFTARSIPQWRGAWLGALQVADEIVCFSNSSRVLVLRAYPELAQAPISVRPHAIESFDRVPAIEMDAPLHIGVVGAIGVHKGARVLQALAARISETGLPVRITVIGSVELPCDPQVLTSTGAFQREQLPELIEKSGANVFLLPSICPETFSYVTQELMSLRVPLACFDLGAPAERVASYSRGLVLPWLDAEHLLSSLYQFHQRLALVDPRNPS